MRSVWEFPDINRHIIIESLRPLFFAEYELLPWEEAHRRLVSTIRGYCVGLSSYVPDFKEIYIFLVPNFLFEFVWELLTS